MGKHRSKRRKSPSPSPILPSASVYEYEYEYDVESAVNKSANLFTSMQSVVQEEANLSHTVGPMQETFQPREWKKTISLLQTLESIDNIPGAQSCWRSVCNSRAHMSSIALLGQFLALLIAFPLVAWYLLTPWGFRKAVHLFSRSFTVDRARPSTPQQLAFFALLALLAPLAGAAAVSLCLMPRYWAVSQVSVAERVAPTVSYTILMGLLFAWLVQKRQTVEEHLALVRLRRILRRAGGARTVEGAAKAAATEAAVGTAMLELGLGGLHDDGTLAQADAAGEEQQQSDESDSDTGSSGSNASDSGLLRVKPQQLAEEDAVVDRIEGLLFRAGRSRPALVASAFAAVLIGVAQALVAPLSRMLLQRFAQRYAGEPSRRSFLGSTVWHDGVFAGLSVWAMFVVGLVVSGFALRTLNELRTAARMLQALQRAGSRQTLLVVGTGSARRPWMFTLSSHLQLSLWRDVRTRVNRRWLTATREAGPVVALSLAGVLVMTLFLLVRLVTASQRRFLDTLGLYALLDASVLLALLYLVVSAGISISRFKISQQYYLTEQKHRLRESTRAATAEEAELARAIDTQILAVAEAKPPAILGIDLTVQLRNRILGVVITTMAGAAVRFIDF